MSRNQSATKSSHISNDRNARYFIRPAIHTSVLFYCALQVAFVSFLFSYYAISSKDVIDPVVSWSVRNLKEITLVNKLLEYLRNWVERAFKLFEHDYVKAEESYVKPKKEIDVIFLLKNIDDGLPVFNKEQLSFFDGTRTSKDTYLAILGRIYNVQKGIKHYGVGGSYHFFAGRDGTRSFVSGDFSEEGLTDNIDGLNQQDLLGIMDWIKFYEKDYDLVGYLQGTYFDSHGKPTSNLRKAIELMSEAQFWKRSQIEEAKVFPPCNSEWRKDSGGRIWCSKKSGGIERDWVGVPRKLFNPADNSFKCVCVKNFGSPLSSYPNVGKNSAHGDLENPLLREYNNCNPSSISCKNDAS